MGRKTKGLRKNFYRDRQNNEYQAADGIIDQAKEYANLAYLVGLLGAIPEYVARMQQIYKRNAYVRSVLDHHPDPILALSGRFRGDPDRTCGEDLDRGSGSQGPIGMQMVGEVARRKKPGSFCTLRRKDLDAFIEEQVAYYRAVKKQDLRQVAREAWEKSAKSNLTHGATLYENIKDFGFPKDWDPRKVKEIASYLDHVFFIELRSRRKG